MLASLAPSRAPAQLSTQLWAQLGRLARATRVHDQLDWWHLDEWLDSDALVTLTDGDTLAAALLVVPVAVDDRRSLARARAASAWLRWCAVADGVGASAAMRALFAEASARLRPSRVRELYCATEPANWLLPYLQDAGFIEHDQVVSYTRSIDAPGDTVHRTEALALRDAVASDLPAIEALDRGAFDELWHYSREVLQRALDTGNVFRVAEREKALVGYHFVSIADGSAHLTRIAVRAGLQRRGIGRALMDDALARAKAEGAHTMTLNTQASNTPSQHLYAAFGFRQTGPPLIIRRLRL